MEHIATLYVQYFRYALQIRLLDTLVTSKRRYMYAQAYLLFLTQWENTYLLMN